jgi:hypothetical protein
VLDAMGGLRAKIDAALESALWGVIAAAAASSGLLFLVVALFIWLAARYDPLTACLVLGVIFAAAAAVSATASALTGRPSRRRQHRVARPANPDLHDLLAVASEGGQQATEALRKAAATVSEDLKQTVRRRPLAALGLVLCAGFVFGATRRR